VAERRANPIRLKARVLVIALVVGLGFSINLAEAQAPLATQVMKMTPKQMAHKSVMAQWGTKKEFACLDRLIHHESKWNHLALNKSSGAFGLFQFLPSTWGNYKYPFKPRDPAIQIKAGLRYITKRYETPCNAWQFWQHQAQKGNPWY
jgi:soluble lytic murein transglycosylase-like protein